MFISKVQLINFKRFTNLTLDLAEVDPAARLVLLIGANGSGKSAVFDAFEWVSSLFKDRSNGADENYYKKVADLPTEVFINFHDGQAIQRRDGKNSGNAQHGDLFYGRSAFRQVPQLTRTGQGGQIDFRTDSDRPRLYIERDQRFENDIDVLTRRILEEVFSGTDFDSHKLTEQYVTPLNNALERIFGSDPATALALRTLIPPLNGKIADIRFRKGESDIHYNLLSSGEKEVVNILLNLFVRREVYRDAIYFIDELDVHLNTALQYTLLKEITENWLPAGCQLWTASHSLGFIQYARAAQHAVILDFDQFDFDHTRTIYPQSKASLEVYEIAVPRETILQLFAGKQIILCENKNDEYYNLLGLENKLFVGVTDKNQVYLETKKNPHYYGLLDRDYLTETEVARIRQRLPNLFVLDYYSFESYLYHPANLQEVNPAFDGEGWKTELRRQKAELYDNILLGLKQARSYLVLKTEQIEDKDLKAIITALKSDDFEEFYPYLDLKSKVNRAFLAKYNLAEHRLVRTNWFRTAIAHAVKV